MCTLADRAVTGNPKVEPETHTDARADVAALRDGEPIRDEEVAVATEAAGVGGWEDAGGVTANAAARARVRRGPMEEDRGQNILRLLD